MDRKTFHIYHCGCGSRLFVTSGPIRASIHVSRGANHFLLCSTIIIDTTEAVGPVVAVPVVDNREFYVCSKIHLVERAETLLLVHSVDGNTYTLPPLNPLQIINVRKTEEPVSWFRGI